MLTAPLWATEGASGLNAGFRAPTILASAEHPGGLAREGAGHAQAAARRAPPWQSRAIAAGPRGAQAVRSVGGHCHGERGDSGACYPAGMTLATHVAPTGGQLRS